MGPVRQNSALPPRSDVRRSRRSAPSKPCERTGIPFSERANERQTGRYSFVTADPI
jgi:hypothetical protein